MSTDKMYAEQIANEYAPKKTSKIVAPATNINGYGLSHKRENIFPLGHVDFEGHSLPAPADTDGYLTEVYGDWRTIPPVGKRKIHAVYMNTKLDKKQ